MAPSKLNRGTAALAQCDKCPFSKYDKPNAPVFSEYPDDPLFVVIGEGPGRNEVLLKRPFVGPSGQVVNKMLKWAGVDREKVFVGNATLCQPIGAADEALKLEAAKACSARLKMELKKFPGKPVLALGGVAAKALIPEDVLLAIEPPDKLPSHKRKVKSKLKEEARKKRLDAAQQKRRLTVLTEQALKEFPPEDGTKAAKKQAAANAALVAEQRLGQMTGNAALGDVHAIEQLGQLDQEVNRWLKLGSLRQQLFDQHMKDKHRPGQKKPTRRLMTSLAVEALERMEKGAARGESAAITKLVELEACVEAILNPPPKEKKPAAPNPNAPPKKKRGVGISDIASTHFRIDLKDSTGERSLIPTIHPAAILRGGGKVLAGTHTPDLAFWNLVSDTAKVKALALGHPVQLTFNIETEYENSQRAAELFLRIYHAAIEHGEYALDLETYVEDDERHHALQAYMAKVRALGLATPTYSVSVLWDLLPAWCFHLLRTLLIHPRVKKTFHNGLYDRTVLEANSFPVDGPWEDTLLGHHAAFPGMAHNLQMVTAQFKAVEPWKSEFRNNEETPDRLTLYNARDTQATAVIRPGISMWIQRTKSEQVYAMDRKMAECASMMHLHGVPMSRDVNSELFTQFSDVIKATRHNVEALLDDADRRKQVWHHLAFEQAKRQRKTDPDDFRQRHAIRLAETEQKFAKGRWAWKISANQHVAALLRSLGVQLLHLTDTGATKVNREILEGLIEVPVVREILRFRENDKRLMTFVWPIFDRLLKDGSTAYGFADPYDRVHPIWSIHKISGRWASTDPVCSNVPKEKIKKHPDGRIEIIVPNLRAQVVAPPGRMLVGFDYAQLEARILALVSGDQWLCNVFAQGLDIHREAAKIIFPGFEEKDPKIQKQLRDLAKPFEYGAFYGADPETLYKALVKAGHSMKREDVFKAYYTLMGRLEGLAKYQQNIVVVASQPPFEITSFLLKRRRCFPMGEADRNECLNFPIQSSAADIMNTGMERMMGRLHRYKQAFPILQIHDAAVFECWEDDAERLLVDVIDAFTQEYEVNGIRVPFGVDAKIARSWAQL